MRLTPVALPMSDGSRTVPSPRPITVSIPPLPKTTPAGAGTSPTRRLSLNISSPTRRTQPLPVPIPARHGSISFPTRQSQRQRPSFSGSEGPLSASIGRGSLSQGQSGMFSRSIGDQGQEGEGELDNGYWLDGVIGDIEMEGEVSEVMDGETSMEHAVEALLASEDKCLLVKLGNQRYSFLDFSDLNVFLLLVLKAASTPSPLATIDQDAGVGSESSRSADIMRLLRSGRKVPISAVCNVSNKNTCHLIDTQASLKSILPLLASGVHRLLVETDDTRPPRIVSASIVLRHLVTLSPSPTIFHQTFFSPLLDLPLHPLISLSGTASVLDAMQIMASHGLSALGVLNTSPSSSFSSRGGHHRAGSSSSGSSTGAGPGGGNYGLSRTRTLSLSHSQSHRKSGSFGQYSKSSSQVFTSPAIGPTSPGIELPSPFDSGGGGGGGPELVGVITAEECARLVVPSEGKQVLGMGLEEAVKGLQVSEHGGQERGEEKVLGKFDLSCFSLESGTFAPQPRFRRQTQSLTAVHMITPHTSLLRASHLILAVSSSRVFLPHANQSFGMSPSPSLSYSASTLSPSISALSLLPDPAPSSHGPDQGSTGGLPEPPSTKISPHSVISITDILGSMVRAYLPNEGPVDHRHQSTWVTTSGSAKIKPVNSPTQQEGTHIPESSSGLGAGLGLETWKWAKGSDVVDNNTNSTGGVATS